MDNLVKGVQCYELFGGITLKNHAFSFISYLMLFVCMMLPCFPLISANAFYFHVLSCFIDTVCLFHVLICIMHSAFNLLVFHNSMFTPLLFFNERSMCSPEK